jgi:glyoxylase-like metal-dependent hydrolase (beta-lactamase superfamily II)
LRIELLNVGWMTAAAGLWRQGEEDPQRPARVPVPAYLIETESERILVDTGLHHGAAADAATHYDGAPAVGLFQLEQERSIADQVDLATVTRVVLTHLHFDHAGGSALLPSSLPVFIQRREWEAGADPEAVARNFFLPRDYEGLADQVVFVDGDHDLLGDGSVELLSTPGHTPGHQSVRVGDGLVIGGDVTHFAAGLDDHRLPIFGDDRDVQLASAERLRALRDAGAEVRPGHDPEVLVPGPVLR